MFFTPMSVFNPKGSLQFLARSTDISDASSFNFSDASFPLGAPDATRRIFLGIAWRIPTGTTMRTLSSGSIDPEGVVGATAITIHGQVGFYEAVNGGYGVALASVVVATGTIGTISLVFSGTLSECTVTVFRKTSLVDAVPFDTATVENEGTQTALSTTIDTAEGGILLAICAQGSILGTPAWTAGVTEVERFQTAESVLEILTGMTQRTAAATGATVSSSTSVDSGAVGNGLVAVSWR